MWNHEFQYFLNQHSNVYLKIDERQALRTRKHYIQIFFLDDSIEISMFENYVGISHHLIEILFFINNFVIS